jgi:hypothetical protein
LACFAPWRESILPLSTISAFVLANHKYLYF